MILRPLRIRGLTLHPPLVLAPMAGLTHTAFRRLVGEMGGVGLFSTEMLSARALPYEPDDHPFLLRSSKERPLSWQLLVGSPDEVAPAIDRLHELEADVVDINLGCPAPEARRRRGGAFLAADLKRAKNVVREARRRTDLPLTAKVRIGFRLEEAPLKTLCGMLEDEGVDLITVHARLVGERYGRPARWEWIGRVKKWVSIPVLGNGDIFSVEDARRCVMSTGCDGLMIGRGAAIRPWVFGAIAAALCGQPVPPQCKVGVPWIFERFVTLLQESFPPERQLGRLKEFAHYISRNYQFGHWLASAVQASRSVGQAVERARRFFEENDTAWVPDSP